MKKEVGLWIDQRKAVILIIENDIVTTWKIQSNIDKHVRLSSATSSKKTDQSAGAGAEDTRDRQIGTHLDGFYDGILSFIRGATAIFIFGPGEAKVELQNRLKQEGLGELIGGVLNIDKMTDAQIEARIRKHFLRY